MSPGRNRATFAQYKRVKQSQPNQLFLNTPERQVRPCLARSKLIRNFNSAEHNESLPGLEPAQDVSEHRESFE